MKCAQIPRVFEEDKDSEVDMGGGDIEAKPIFRELSGCLRRVLGRELNGPEVNKSYDSSIQTSEYSARPWVRRVRS